MVDVRLVDEWFMREVLPLEAALMRFLRNNGRGESDPADLRQELYVQLYEAARRGLPTCARAFAFRVARNLLINQLRRSRVVSMEAMADLETLNIAVTTITPEQEAAARNELRRLQAGLRCLPAKCREVVELRRIDGLSQTEVATRLGVCESTVEKQLAYGLRALTDFMLGGDGKIRRAPATLRKKAEAVRLQEEAVS